MNRTFTLPKKLLLKKPEEFRNIYRNGSRVEGEGITLYYKESGILPLLVGFSTTKKVRKAVYRNRARRLMKEVFRLHRFKLRKGMVYVFLWTGTVIGVDFNEVEARMLGLMKKEGLYPNISKILYAFKSTFMKAGLRPPFSTVV